MCKCDNGHWQVTYSNMAGAVSGAALASTYYPSSNQGTDILQNSPIRMGESSLASIMQEFVFRKLTKGGVAKTHLSRSRSTPSRFHPASLRALLRRKRQDIYSDCSSTAETELTVRRGYHN
jgi:hypothetical protein